VHCKYQIKNCWGSSGPRPFRTATSEEPVRRGATKLQALSSESRVAPGPWRVARAAAGRHQSSLDTRRIAGIPARSPAEHANSNPGCARQALCAAAPRATAPQSHAPSLAAAGRAEPCTPRTVCNSWPLRVDGRGGDDASSSSAAALCVFTALLTHGDCAMGTAGGRARSLFVCML